MPRDGWLQRQLERNSADIATWPEWMKRELGIPKGEQRMTMAQPQHEAADQNPKCAYCGELIYGHAGVELLCSEVGRLRAEKRTLVDLLARIHDLTDDDIEFGVSRGDSCLWTIRSETEEYAE